MLLLLLCNALGVRVGLRHAITAAPPTACIYGRTFSASGVAPCRTCRTCAAPHAISVECTPTRDAECKLLVACACAGGAPCLDLEGRFCVAAAAPGRCGEGTAECSAPSAVGASAGTAVVLFVMRLDRLPTHRVKTRRFELELAFERALAAMGIGGATAKVQSFAEYPTDLYDILAPPRNLEEFMGGCPPLAPGDPLVVPLLLRVHIAADVRATEFLVETLTKPAFSKRLSQQFTVEGVPEPGGCVQIAAFPDPEVVLATKA